jgi:hypothetical protein
VTFVATSPADNNFGECLLSSGLNLVRPTNMNNLTKGFTS